MKPNLSTSQSEVRAHWDAAYRELSPTGVSWFEPQASLSLALVDQLQLPVDTPIVDVGGGASRFVDGLLTRGFSDVTVLDLSEEALAAARERLGPRASEVHWINEDLLRWKPNRQFGLWHDRALYHFLTDQADQDRYVELLRASARVPGYVVLATFAPDGPEFCSGLPVVRYGLDELAGRLGERFKVIGGCRDPHVTPSGQVQPFTWIVAGTA